MTRYFTIKHMLASEHPEREVWDLLSLNTTDARLSSTTGFEFNRQQLQSIRTLFGQSKQLYDASATVSLECSPLIDFYCYSMLAKILSIKSLRRGLETFPQAHGLTFHLDTSKPIDTDNVIIEINNRGTFIELLRSLKKLKPIEDYAGSRVTLTELLLHDIDVHDYMPFDAKNLPIHSFEIVPLQNRPGATHQFQIQIRLTGEQRPTAFENAKKEVPELDLSAFTSQNIIRIDLPGYPIFLNYNPDQLLPDFGVELNFAGQTFLVPPIATDKEKLLFYQIEIIYLVLYAASNLVRYYPNQWIELLSDEKRMWHLRKAMGLARRSFPNHVLNWISEEFHIILPPGTLHYQ